jgi:large subunit ribosomal protein L29
MEGVTIVEARRAMQLAAAKLPIKTKFATRFRAGEQASMKPAEVRELSVDELRQREKDLDDQIFRLRIQKSMGQLEAPAKVRGVRRDLARIKTILREKTVGPK